MTEVGPDGGDPKRRILDDFGSDTGFLAFIDVSNADLLFLGPVLVGAVFVLELVVIATGRFFVGLGIALTILAVAATYVYVCPDHRTPIGLLQSFITYYRGKTTMTHTNIQTGEHDGINTWSGGDVRELTRVQTVETEVDAIRRHDETLVTAVRIEPANLALADDQQWEQAARGLGNVLNAIEFPIQIHSAARRIDPERMTAVYKDRRTDPDVQASPVLEDIVEVYRRRRPQEFRRRGTSVRQYYALVPVDIQAVSLEAHRWVRRLERMPLVGNRCAPLLADWLMRHHRQATIEERQREILTERRRRLTQQLRSVEGVDVQPLSAGDIAELVEEYWSGMRTDYPDAGPHLRTTPVVMSNHSEAAQRDGTSVALDTNRSPSDSTATVLEEER